jgi:hypothetical protein
MTFQVNISVNDIPLWNMNMADGLYFHYYFAHWPLKAQWLLYSQPVLTLKNSTFCPHTVLSLLHTVLRTNSDYFPKQHIHPRCTVLWPTISSLLDHPVCEGIPVLQPSRFYPCPSGRSNFKAVRGLDIWKTCLVLCLPNVWFISVKKLATIDYVVLWAFFSHGNLTLFLRILNWSAKDK